MCYRVLELMQHVADPSPVPVKSSLRPQRCVLRILDGKCDGILIWRVDRSRNKKRRSHQRVVLAREWFIPADSSTLQ